MAHQVQALPRGDLHPYAGNPRQIAEGSVRELAAAIAEQGQLQPCVVRRFGDAYEVLVGHRRIAAQEYLGAATVPCVVVEADDAMAMAIVVTGNSTIEPPDPFAEADLVAQLLEDPDASIESVADLLGWPVRKVARRARVAREVHGEVWQRRADFERWSFECWEAFALLPKDLQPEAARRMQWWTRPEEIERAVRDDLRQLKHATWKLDDEVLCPAAGSCLACPKTSRSQPGLFDEEQPDNLATARCLDPTCWEQKKAAALEQKVAAAREKHGADLLLVCGSGEHADKVDGVAPLPSYHYDVVKKDTPGARPALVVTGKPRTLWVKPNSWAREKATGSAKGGKSAKDATPAEKLKKSRQRIAERRAGWVVHEARALILGDDGATVAGEDAAASVTPPSFEDLLGLVVAFEVRRDVDVYDEKKRVKAARAAVEAIPTTWVDVVWPRVRRAVAESLDYHQGSDAPKRVKWLRELVGLGIAIDVDGLEERAREAIPDPRWWATAKSGKRSAKKSAPKRAAKKASKRKAKSKG